MSYISLYRKYRPKSFRDITGQEFIVRTLTNAIKQSKVSHAYIFAGPKGIGKTTIAKIFAKAVNCLHPIDGDACNQCEHCKIINENQTTDILELDAASNNGVDEVRSIIEGVRFLPANLNKKVYIIDEAHMLTTQAWNAMLKTVEEAPSHVIFIFATTEMHKIPATILSRSQHFLFSRLTNEQLTNMISDIASKESIKVDQDAIAKIVVLADGSARDALSILEQMAMYTNNQVALKDIIELFGLIDLDNKINLINLVLAKDTQAIMKLLDQYSENGINFSQLANDLTVILIDKLIYLQTKNIAILKALNETNVEAININENECIKLINVWQESFMKMRNAIDLRFYFELAIFNSFEINSQEAQKIPSSIVQPKNEIKQPIQTKNESPSNMELPPLDKVFKVTTYAKPDKPKIKETVIKPSVVLDKELLFNQIAHNNNKTSQDIVKTFLSGVKDHNRLKVLSFVVAAEKVLVASNNGAILLFNDEIDAELLNIKTKNYDFLIEIKKYFGHPIYFIGFSKEESKKLAQSYMLARKQGQTYDEPDVTPLKEILKANNSIEQAAFEIFGGE
ncbi:MAG: DNA polymerase III subunit gamma/tau [Mycoplasmataceae bacterium]|jgi:DNA polymerase-3 subunit gamma/tau|nr:DNA polymerase III subunit gamma/tau [Mycoplasmataceae bacterium]